MCHLASGQSKVFPLKSKDNNLCRCSPLRGKLTTPYTIFAVDGTEDRWQSEGEENVETVYLFSLDLTTGNLHCSGASGNLRAHTKD